MQQHVLELLTRSLSLAPLLLAALLLRRFFVRRYVARFRCLLWLVLAIALLLPGRWTLPLPAVTVPLPQEITVSLPQEITDTAAGELFVPVAEPGSSDAAVPQPLPQTEPVPQRRGVPPLQLAAAVWLCGTASVLLWQLGGHLLFRRRIFRWQQPTADETVWQTLAQESMALGVRWPIAVGLCPAIEGPMMVGLWHPVILLPHTDYPQETLRLILRHELAHYRRRDIWYKLLLTAAWAVYWFHPLVWLMVHAAEQDIEAACDEAVVRGGDPDLRRRYSEVILDHAQREQGRGPLFSTGFACKKQVLRQRFTAICSTAVRHRGRPVLIVTAMFALVTAGCVTFGPSEGAALPPQEEISKIEEVPLPEDPVPDYLTALLDRETMAGEYPNYKVAVTRLDEDVTVSLAPYMLQRYITLLEQLQLRPAQEGEQSSLPFERPIELCIRNTVSGAEDRYTVSAEGIRYQGALYVADRPEEAGYWLEEIGESMIGFRTGELYTVSELLNLDPAQVTRVERTSYPAGGTLAALDERAREAAEELLQWVITPADGRNPMVGGGDEYRLTLNDGRELLLVNGGFVTLPGDAQCYEAVRCPGPQVFSGVEPLEGRGEQEPVPTAAPVLRYHGSRVVGVWSLEPQQYLYHPVEEASLLAAIVPLLEDWDRSDWQGTLQGGFLLVTEDGERVVCYLGEGETASAAKRLLALSSEANTRTAGQIQWLVYMNAQKITRIRYSASDPGTKEFIRLDTTESAAIFRLANLLRSITPTDETTVIEGMFEMNLPFGAYELTLDFNTGVTYRIFGVGGDSDGAASLWIGSSDMRTSLGYTIPAEQEAALRELVRQLAQKEESPQT